MNPYSPSVRQEGEGIESFVRRILAYSPETGEFRWKETRNGRALTGSIAGSSNQDGYTAIRIEGRVYLAHRLAFIFMVGALPRLDVDHRNGQRTDNRWSNLRLATKQINAQNLREATRRNRSGFLGVCQSGGRFRAVIKARGKVFSLGTYGTAEDAHDAYIQAKRTLHEGGTI